MFIGHYGIALAAKKASPDVSLGLFFIAAQFLDLLWPVLLLFGVEHVRVAHGDTSFTPLNFYDYPISHSLVGTVLWAVLLGLAYIVYKKLTKRRAKNSDSQLLKNALLIGLVVISHWALDFITHLPDLPLSFSQNTFLGKEILKCKIRNDRQELLKTKEFFTGEQPVCWFHSGKDGH